MRINREASSTTALSFSRPVRQRSADFAERAWASRSGAESFSERSPTVQSAECVRSFPVVKGMEPEENSLQRMTDARQAAGSAAEKSSWEKSPQALTSGEREQTECPFPEPAIGSGRSRAASHLTPTALLQSEPANGCEPSLFSVGQVPPLALERLTEIDDLSLPNVEKLRKNAYFP
jgi:hypothetical protein